MDYSHQARGESWDILLVCVSSLYFINICKIAIMILLMKHELNLIFISAKYKST